MRIAIVSSPRSGNTWIRRLVSDALSLPELAVHNYLDAENIPDRCIFQLHWYREPNFQRFLSDHRFQVVTVARHPLDVLISVLHFIRYEPETAKWLCGNCELPQSLAGQSAASNDFLDYALSFGSENLLSVTYQWWHDASAIKVRYEDFVADPMREASRLIEQLDVANSGISQALAANSLDWFKSMPNRHGWQGTPHLWRELVPSEYLEAIFMRHQRNFEMLGYSVDAAPVRRADAEASWARLLR